MKVRVYYADTDAGGVVYHANYLRWLEMARCELVASLGTSVAEYAKQGVIFAVVRLEVDYHGAAVLGDELAVETQVERVRRVRFTVRQRVIRCLDNRELTAARITVACVEPQGKVRSLPAELAVPLRARAAAEAARAD